MKLKSDYAAYLHKVFDFEDLNSFKLEKTYEDFLKDNLIVDDDYLQKIAASIKSMRVSRDVPQRWRKKKKGNAFLRDNFESLYKDISPLETLKDAVIIAKGYMWRCPFEEGHPFYQYWNLDKDLKDVRDLFLSIDRYLESIEALKTQRSFICPWYKEDSKNWNNPVERLFPLLLNEYPRFACVEE